MFECLGMDGLAFPTLNARYIGCFIQPDAATKVFHNSPNLNIKNRDLCMSC